MKLRKYVILIVSLLMSNILQAEPMIVAHRGASHDAPENTLSAFNLAWQQGADAIECDVWMTKDAKLVCIHDRSTKRTAKKNLDVTQSTLEELRSLDAGSWKGAKWKGEQIPTLDEVLATIPKGKTIFVEIKGDPVIVSLLPDVIERSKLAQSQVVIISFDKKVVLKAKKTLPKIKAFLIIKFEYSRLKRSWSPTIESVMKDLKRTGADGLDLPAAEVVDKSFVKMVHDAGKELHVWTINSVSLAERYKGFGVDSITTDKPKVIKGR